MLGHLWSIHGRIWLKLGEPGPASFELGPVLAESGADWPMLAPTPGTHRRNSAGFVPIWANSTRIRPNSGKIDRIRPESRQHGQFSLHLTEFLQPSTKHGSFLPGVGRHWPKFTNVWPRYTDFGRVWPKFGQHRPKLGRFAPILTESGQMFGQTGSTVGQIRRSLAEGVHVLPNMANSSQSLAQVGKTWPNLGSRHLLDNFWARHRSNRRLLRSQSWVGPPEFPRCLPRDG